MRKAPAAEASPRRSRAVCEDGEVTERDRLQLCAQRAKSQLACERGTTLCTITRDTFVCSARMAVTEGHCDHDETNNEAGRALMQDCARAYLRARRSSHFYCDTYMSTRLDLARRLLALSQTGLHFCREEYDRERYREVADIATQLLALESEHSAQQLHATWFVEDGYATPKIDVRGACFRGEQVLLVRERVDGKWTLPGGWADVNDSPSYAVEKEIEQESGFTARAAKLAAVYDRNKHNHPTYLFHLWKVFFICDITGGEARGSYETTDVGFFSLDRLPELSTGRTTEAQIKRMYEHHLDRARPTEFD